MAERPVGLHEVLLSTMAEGLVVYDEMGRIVFCNAAAQAILARDAHRLMGRHAADSDWEPIHLDGTPFAVEGLPSVTTRRTRQPAGPLIIGIRDGIGARIWLRLQTQPIDSEVRDGIRGVVLATFTDISELIVAQAKLRDTMTALEQSHAAEQALSGRLTAFLGRQLDQSLATLALSEHRFRLAMELGTTVAFILDMDLRYTWAHSCQVGFEDEVLIGKTEFEFFTHETATMLTALYREVLDTGLGKRLDVRVQSLAAEGPQYFDLIVQPLRDLAGEVSGLIGAAIDITRRIETEQELRRAKADAEQAFASKSRFLAAASHDLSQPMQALQMYCAILADRQPSPGLQAKQCANKLANQLKALLSLSRLDGGAVEARLVPVRLGEMLDQVAASLRPLAEEKGVRLRVVLTRRKVETDPILFERLLGNLVANAVRYTRAGGVVLGCRHRGGRLLVEVWDSGIGIPADKVSLIFEELYQIHNPTRDPEHGAGLGLAIVSRIAPLLGMRVTVRSQVGRGSVFAVELPG